MLATTRKFGPFEKSTGRPTFINFENFLTSNTVKVNPLSPTLANICSLIYSTYHLTDDPVWQTVFFLFFGALVWRFYQPFKSSSRKALPEFDIGKMNLKLPKFSNFYPIIPEISTGNNQKIQKYLKLIFLNQCFRVFLG